jgi:predicted MFS family arabinose efflux permease
MPLRLFSSRTRVGSYIVMLVTGAAVFAMFYFLVQYVQQVKGYSPLKAGFAFLPVSAVIVVIAQLASRLVTKVGAQALIVFGTISAGLGLLWLSSLSIDSSYPAHLLPAIALIALGMGSIFVPITLTAVADVDPGDTGIASAMLNVCQQVGGTIGLSALVTVFTTASNNYGTSHPRPTSAGAAKLLTAHAFTHGADMAFRAGALFTVIALVAGFVLIRFSPSQTDVESAAPIG